MGLRCWCHDRTDNDLAAQNTPRAPRVYFGGISRESQRVLRMVRADLACIDGTADPDSIPWERVLQHLIERMPALTRTQHDAAAGRASHYAGHWNYMQTAAVRELTREGRGQRTA